MTLKEAKALKQGSMIHHRVCVNADGSPCRAKVSSVKTWKTRPNEVEVRAKYGLKTFLRISEDDIELWNIGDGRD